MISSIMGATPGQDNSDTWTCDKLASTPIAAGQPTMVSDYLNYFAPMCCGAGGKAKVGGRGGCRDNRSSKPYARGGKGGAKACNNCGVIGHLAGQCPEPAQCHACGSTAHAGAYAGFAGVPTLLLSGGNDGGSGSGTYGDRRGSSGTAYVRCGPATRALLLDNAGYPQTTYLIDEGVSTTYYSDADGDGFGDTESAFPSCGSPTGVVSLPGDCDDTNPLINPAADEVCDGVDQDCDGVADDGAVDGTVASYMDVDGDGFGAGAAVIECTVPSGYSPVDGDCDDFDPFVSPDALEVCNGQDDDCDAAVDEGLLTEFYTDGDGDGFGTEPVLACSLPPGAGAEPGDCDDARADGALRAGHRAADARADDDDVANVAEHSILVDQNSSTAVPAVPPVNSLEHHHRDRLNCPLRHNRAQVRHYHLCQARHEHRH